MTHYPSHLDLTTASAFKQDLLSCLQGDRACEFDLVSVDRASLAHIQLLAAAWKQAKAQNVTLKVTLSPALDKAMDVLGYPRFEKET